MNASEVLSMADETGLTDTLDQARTQFFSSVLQQVSGWIEGLGLTDQAAIPSTRLDEFAFALERLGLESPDDDPNRALVFDHAFACRRATLAAGVRARLVTLARLSSDALLGDKPTELTMLLRELPESDVVVEPGLEWPGELEARSLRAFVLLTRRAGGWRDIEEASQEIARLRGLQAQVERTYLTSSSNPESAIVGLIARYNLARIVDIAASYVTNGLPADPLPQLERHRNNVARLLDLEPDMDLRHTTDLVSAGCRTMVRNSIWFSTRTLGARVRDFVRLLTAQGAAVPLLELWPSQREALSGGLLDPARRAIVAEMPTSAGKTLVAEFSIVQALALNPESRVAYLVPTRALVNQVARQLRRDLGGLGYAVEAAVPVFELDPTESLLLSQPINVLVTTPEKLDLLLRQGHPIARDLSLVVADEAHNLGIDERGARLELLLATLKRERPESRFLLLTPFVPNAIPLARWLADDAGAAIRVNWRPSERVAAAAYVQRRRKEPQHVHLLTLPSAQRVDLNTELDVDLGPVTRPPAAGRAGVSVALAEKLAARGGVLVLVNGKGRAETRAEEIARTQGTRHPSELVDAVANLAATELGSDAALPDLLRRGVAYHHAGLPHELRYLVELLVDHGDVGTVCGTTTLAQGVNFPIASVIVESIRVAARRGGRRTWRNLTHEEFWNIAGRAGRALRDRVGLIAFPVDGQSEIGTVRDFLQDDASNVVSALTDSLRAASGAAHEFNLRLIADHPTVGVFLQYLTHAVRVAGADVPTDVEDLLRSSLVYHQVRAADRDLAEQLVSFARSFVDETSGKNRGYLALADRTGFSLSSVDYLSAVSRREHPDFADPRFWLPSQLFGDNLDPLAEVVSVLGGVPELSLGREDQGPFNPRLVAGIVRDWVEGASVAAIADRWFPREPDIRERRRDAASYLFSSLVGQIPWGLGALQNLTITGDAPAEAAHVPFMVFYGVNSGDATRLRMAGVPRSMTAGLVRRWRQEHPDSTSFAQIRGWLDGLPDQAWTASVAPVSPLTAAQSKLVWRELAGIPVTDIGQG